MPGLVAILAAALTTATGAQAQTTPPPEPIDLIASLDAVCISAGGDRARAAELAIEAGFSPVPASMVPALRNSSETAGFMKSSAADVTFVLTGTMSRRVGRERVTMEICGVTSRPTEHRPLDQRLRQTMGFAPVSDGGMDIYAWLQTPEGRAPARELRDPTFLAMAGTGQMRMVGLQRSGPGSTLIYFLPRLD
ncbi:hypothetical protein [Brevundimonas sp. TWP2-3-4b1]|uniref:hypothetical protein n=1 Tax=Brevundimonas sp. TWP2-3-4b1 TaxID=2804580 RepID=UPI003CF7D036